MPPHYPPPLNTQPTRAQVQSEEALDQHLMLPNTQHQEQQQL